MFVEQLERRGRGYTDKYVVVVGDRPELARFQGHVGLVKTVNMNGKALVEFLDYHENIGWYDIDLDYLKIVEKPAEPETEKPAATPQPKSKPKTGLSPLEQLRQQGGTRKPASKPAEEKKLSPLEILRQQAAAKKAAEQVSAEESAPPTEEPLPTDDAPKQKPSTADILAELRKKKSDL